MKTSALIPWLLAIGFALVAFVPNSCNHHYTEKVVKIYDSIPVPGVAQIDTHFVSYPVPIPTDVDTFAVLADYFSRKEYKSIYRDSSISLTIRPVISMNALDSISLEYKWLKPLSITRIESRQKHALYVGAQIGFDGFVGPRIDYIKSDQWKAGIAYGLTDQSPGLQLSFGWRVF